MFSRNIVMLSILHIFFNIKNFNSKNPHALLTGFQKVIIWQNCRLIAREFARIHSATQGDIETSHGCFEEFRDPLIMLKTTHKNLPTSYKNPVQNERLDWFYMFWIMLLPLLVFQKENWIILFYPGTRKIFPMKKSQKNSTAYLITCLNLI